MAGQDNLHIVREIFAAWNAHDVFSARRLCRPGQSLGQLSFDPLDDLWRTSRVASPTSTVRAR